VSTYVGSAEKKLGALPLLSGRGNFVDDIKVSGTTYLALLRSPYAHAKILSIDTNGAMKLPGVLRVVTGSDLKEIVNPFPQSPKMKGLKHHLCYPMAIEKVRFQGEPVAAVVAQQLYQAFDALDEIKVEYEPLKPVTSIGDATAKDAVNLYDEWENNLTLEYTLKGGDIDDAFTKADHVVDGEVSIQRQCAAPMECRGYLAIYEPSSGELTVYASTQRPHVLRTLLAEILGVTESKVRIAQCAVGGGFGLKTTPHKEEVLVCALSKLLGMPVKWIETRSENLGAGGQAREQVHRFSAAVKSDGEVLGIKDRMLVDLGAYFPQPGILQTITTMDTITGPYEIKNVLVECFGIATNKPPFYPYRGFGEESATMVYERMMDLIAKKLGMDRVAVRKRNLIKPNAFPYKAATGLVYDSGNYPEILEKVLKLSNYRDFSEEKTRMLQNNRYLGIGLSVFVKPSASSHPHSFVQGYEVATVRMDLSGNVTVLTGIASIGTGSDTAIAQIVADELGVTIKNVEVVQGDTLACSFGFGSFASRSVVLAGSSALLAAKMVKEKILKAASVILKTSLLELEIREDQIYSKISGASIPIGDVSKSILKNPFGLGPDMGPGLEATYYFYPPNITNIPDEQGHMNTAPVYSSGAEVAVVEVLPETGEVKVLKIVVVNDCGKIINPGLAGGQILGGLAQGIGSALYEESVYDTNGSPLNSSFMHYMIPTTMEIPKLEIEFHETLSPFTPIGMKGVGEIGIQAVQATILSAVNDALSTLGIEESRFPISPERLRKRIRGK